MPVAGGVAGSAASWKFLNAAGGCVEHLSVRATVSEALRNRELAAAGRSGRYARRQIWERSGRFVRRASWRLGVLFVLVVAGFVPAALAADGNARWFVMGFGVATALWITVMAVLSLSGTLGAYSGLVGETWVADELRRLRRRGWRIVNGLSLRGKMDIDHIAVGPPGVLVVETKHSEHAWPVGCPGERFMADRLAAAMAQVTRNAKDVSRHEEFKRVIGGAPVRPVLVVDSSEPSPDDAPEWLDTDGVTIVRARHLQKWLGTLNGDALDAERIVRIWTELSQHADRRDKRDARPVPTITQITQQNFAAPAGFLAATFAVSALADVLDLWTVAIVAPAAILSFPRPQRDPRLRWFLGGVWAGCLLSLVVGIAVVAGALLP